MSEADNQDQNLQLRRLLATQETDEIVHKLKNGYFTDDAQEIALQVLNERGFNEEISKEKDAGLRYKTYTGETPEEIVRRKHYEKMVFLSYSFPVIVLAIVLLVNGALLQLTENRILISLTSFAQVIIIGYTFKKFVVYATKYDREDLDIVPSILLMTPVFMMLAFQVLGALF